MSIQLPPIGVALKVTVAGKSQIDVSLGATTTGRAYTVIFKVSVL